MIDTDLLVSNAEVGVVLDQLGIDWERRRSGKNNELYFACPTGNHPDDPHKKRCSIAEDGSHKGVFNCWACDFKGNLIQFVRAMHGFDFWQAVEYLEGKFGSATVAGTEALQLKLKRSKPQRTGPRELPVMQLPTDYRTLTGDARRWLQQERHICNDAIDKYEIGLSTSSKFGPMVTIPVYFEGVLRSVFTAQPQSGGAKRYPKGSPQGEILYNYDRCVDTGEYIMVESILDAIKVWSLTGKESMACFTNMISSRQLELLRPFEHHGVMPDMDGRRGWDLVDRMVPKTGKGTWIYLVPHGKDPGDCSPLELRSSVQWRRRYCDYESDHLSKAMQRKHTSVYAVRKK